MKDNGIVHETPIFCYEQLPCCVFEKPSSALALEAVHFVQMKPAKDMCVQVLLLGQGTE